jgi:hypothetical protein
MLFLLFLFCSVLPIIGHILVGLFTNWTLVGEILLLQLLAFIPLLGPVIAFFVFGFWWGLFFLVIQVIYYLMD